MLITICSNRPRGPIAIRSAGAPSRPGPFKVFCTTARAVSLRVNSLDRLSSSLAFPPDPSTQ